MSDEVKPYTQTPTQEFWKSQFLNLEAAVFPALPSANYHPTPTESLEHFISIPPSPTLSTRIQLAWAILVGKYTDSDDVCFGLTFHGTSVLPFRVRLPRKELVQDALATVQERTSAVRSCEELDLNAISQVSSESGMACDFQSQLDIQSLQQDTTKPSGTGHTAGETASVERAMTLVCTLRRDEDDLKLAIAVTHDANVVTSSEARRMMQQLEHVLHQLTMSLEQSLGEVDVLSPQDRTTLEQWNSAIPAGCHHSVHDLVFDGPGTRSPAKIAVSAWDGDLTYAELNHLSLQLTQNLVQLGLQPKMAVPLCFERCKWVPVAMLAVLRAGAVCVPMDPATPPTRLLSMISDTGAQIILTSPGQKRLFDDLEANVIEVSGSSFLPAVETSPPSISLPEVRPGDLALILFTSGSSGKPKGILMEHMSLSTAIQHQKALLNLDTTSRVIHFASYAFDMGSYEILATVASGGCLCIPSESTRMSNVAGFVQDYQVNWAFFIPSTLTFMRPEDLPTLTTLNMGGEKPSLEVVSAWASRVKLNNIYGPAETTVCCSIGNMPPQGWKPGVVGPPVGSVCWITEPTNPARLAPVGAVGELIVEGPLVTRGYLNQPEKTAAAYIEAPKWLHAFRHPGRPGRLYRTGDLVQYTEEGYIRVIGRKDMQVKLRGQRIELAEVEFNIDQSLGSVSAVVVEMVQLARQNILAAFLQFEKPEANSDHSIDDNHLLRPSTPRFQQQIQTLLGRLRGTIPSFMVPSLFVPLSRLPFTGSGKIDRGGLRKQLLACSSEQLRSYRPDHGKTLSSRAHRAPQGQIEHTVVHLVAKVLSLEADVISMDESFLHCGGNSLLAMQLVMMAKQAHIYLTTSDVLRSPTLATLAAIDQQEDEMPADEVDQPFSQLGMLDPMAFILRVVAPAIASNPQDIVDVLPATPSQEYSLRYPCEYCLLHLQGPLDHSRLQAACRILVERHSILRTVFFRHGQQHLQVILKRPKIEFIFHHCSSDLQAFAINICEQDSTRGLLSTHPSLCFMLIAQSQDQNVLVIRASHALYDDISLSMLCKETMELYEDKLAHPAPLQFARFVKLSRRRHSQAAFDFWREILHGSQMTYLRYPTSLCKREDEADSISVVQTIPAVHPPAGITLATLVKAAWSLTMSSFTGHTDVVFMQMVNNRTTPIAGVETVVGPCLKYLPVRVNQQPGWSGVDLLQAIQNQHIQMLDFQDLDFEDIVRASTPWPTGTPMGTHVVHQRETDGSGWSTGMLSGKMTTFFPSCAVKEFSVVSVPQGSQHAIYMMGPPGVLTQDSVDLLARDMCGYMLALAVYPEKKLVDLDIDANAPISSNSD
jgi:brevianamide F synthase